jgi:hypothetical protein
MFELSAQRADTIRLRLTITRDGAPVNLTGTDIWFTAKRLKNAPDADAVFQKSTLSSSIEITNAIAGEAVVTIDPSDTSFLEDEPRLYCDVQLKEVDIITTVATGRLTILYDITRVSA